MRTKYSYYRIGRYINPQIRHFRTSYRVLNVHFIIRILTAIEDCESGTIEKQKWFQRYTLARILLQANRSNILLEWL